MRALPKRGMARKPPAGLAGAISAAAALGTPPGPSPMPPGPPQAIPGPSSAPPVPDMPAAPPTGAADGLGAGTGGLQASKPPKSVRTSLDIQANIVDHPYAAAAWIDMRAMQKQGYGTPSSSRPD
jgi:hypothetical protein